MLILFYTIKIVYITVFMYVCNILSKADSYSEELYPTSRPQSAGPFFVGCGYIFILTVTSHIWRNNSTMLPNNPQLSNSLLLLVNICITHISSLSHHHSIQWPIRSSKLCLWRLWKHVVDISSILMMQAAEFSERQYTSTRLHHGTT